MAKGMTRLHKSHVPKLLESTIINMTLETDIIMNKCKINVYFQSNATIRFNVLYHSVTENTTFQQGSIFSHSDFFYFVFSKVHFSLVSYPERKQRNF